MHAHHASHRTAATFVAAAGRYATIASPLAHRQIRRWQRRAGAIPDPHLRTVALANLEEERGNLEGAAAFAVIARRRRRPLVTALVAFQALYDLVDSLVERDGGDRGTTRRLHQALHDAVTGRPRRPGAYLPDRAVDDGGYLDALVDACSAAIATLPGRDVVTPLAASATARMIEYQVHNHAADDPDRHRLATWSRTAIPSPDGLRLAWWERAAAAASSLVVFALLAHATQPLAPSTASAIVDAYQPVGALHVLLDSLADRDADAATGDHSLVSHYASEGDAIARLATIAAAAADATRRLPAGAAHATICAAMAAYYLAEPRTRDALPIAAMLGPTARPALHIHRARRRRTRA